MDATAIQGEDEKSLEGNEQQLCSWEGETAGPLALLRKPRCVRMRTLELICWSVLQPTSSHPREVSLSCHHSQICSPNLPTTQQRWAAMTATMQTRRALRRRKGTITDGYYPGRSASAGSVLGAGQRRWRQEQRGRHSDR